MIRTWIKDDGTIVEEHSYGDITYTFVISETKSGVKTVFPQGQRVMEKDMDYMNRKILKFIAHDIMIGHPRIDPNIYDEDEVEDILRYFASHEPASDFFGSYISKHTEESSSGNPDYVQIMRIIRSGDMEQYERAPDTVKADILDYYRLLCKY